MKQRLHRLARIGQAIQRRIKPDNAWRGPFATLTVMKGPSKLEGRAIKMTQPRFTVGRDRANTDLCLYANADTSLSKVHCVFECQPDGVWTVTDDKSTNGTRLNGHQIDRDVPYALKDNDEIQLGVLARYGVLLRFNLLDLVQK